MTTDFTSMILSMREKLTKPLLIVTVLSIVAAFFLGWGFLAGGCHTFGICNLY